MAELAFTPEAERKKVVRENFIAQFELCCRSSWEILAYRNGEAQYQKLLEELIREAEPRIAEFQPFLGPEFGDEVRLLLESRKSYYLAAASRVIVDAGANEGTKTPEVLPSLDAEATTRRKMVNCYIEEVRRQTGRQITRSEIWKSLKYKSRTEFERWERNDPKNPNKTAHDRFVRFFKEKPHLKTDKPRVN